jgi:hypothetical protein
MEMHWVHLLPKMPPASSQTRLVATSRIIFIAAVFQVLTFLAKILGPFWALQIDQRETMVSNNEWCIKEW